MELESARTILTGDPVGQWRNAPEEWHKAILWDLAEYVNGRAFKPDDFSPDGVLVIKIAELKDGITSSTRRYNGSYDHKHLIRRGDILFAWSGNPETSLDVFRWQGDQAILNQHIFKVLPRADIDENYLFFLFKFLRPTFIRTARDKATSMGHVKIADLKRLFAKIPPLGEQKRISEMLASLEFRIEVNRQMNITLEAIGKAIFKQWFIDFEFPNEEGKPYKSSGGEMTYNEELGRDIPKGWEVRPFSELIAVSPKRGLATGRMAKKVGMADVNPWQACIENWGYEQYKSGARFRNGDTLFARITPSIEHGKTALVSILDANEIGFGSTEFIVFGEKVISSELYIFHLARSEEVRDAAIRAMIGSSGRQRVPDELFDYLPTILPPIYVLDQFEKTCRPMFNRLISNAKETKIASEIRDSLLPKLMSGKIRVPVEVR